MTEIAAKAFMECTNLTAITLPEATSIGDECFSSCEELTAVTLPDTLTSIERAVLQIVLHLQGHYQMR